MAGTLNSANCSTGFSWEYREALTLSESSNTGSRLREHAFDLGTAAGQANKVYAAAGTVPAASSVSLDLQSLTDFFSAAFAFDTVRYLYVELTAETPAASVLVGAAGQTTPSAASLSLSVGAGSLAAGTYKVSQTWTTASGETLASTPASIVAALNDRIVVAAVTLPSGATGRKIYVSLVADANALALHTTAADGTAKNIDSAPTTTAAAIPAASTALDGLSTLFGTGADRVRVRNGGCVAFQAPLDSTGYAVSASAKYLKIENEDATYPAKYVVGVIGVDS